MKEFDFDELDKAVNSLMKGAPQSTPVRADDDITTVTLPDLTDDSSKDSILPQSSMPHDAPPETVGDNVAPPPVATHEDMVLEAPETTSSQVENPGPDVVNDATSHDEVTNDVVEKANTSPSPSIAPHRAGRFMDMKHPSADMSTSSSSSSALSAPSRRASRVAAAMKPVGAPIVDVVKRPSLGAPSTVSNDVASEAVQPESTAVVSEADQLDAAVPVADESPSVDTPQVLSSDTSDEPITMNDRDGASVEQTQPPTPVSPPPVDYSAFIPDAKVEKRPLGGSKLAADDAAPVVDSHEVAPESEQDSSAAPDATDTDTRHLDVANTQTTPLSAEFDEHLMAIESGDTPQSEDAAPQVSEKKSKKIKAAQETPPATPPTPTGPVSIQQQYTEAPSSGDASNGAIYDTASYHQPLKYPAKKKSGWLWVVLIVIIILAGGGAGAFLYLNGM